MSPLTLTRRRVPQSAVIWLAVAVLAVAVALGTGAYVLARESTDCARTPQHHPADSAGDSLLRIRQYLAHQYATEPRFVEPAPDGPDAMEMSVFDAAGSHFLGKVRVVRAESGRGWLIATANTCDD